MGGEAPMIYQITRVYRIPATSQTGAKNKLAKAIATGWAHTYLIEETIEERKRTPKSFVTEFGRQLYWLIFGTKRK